MHIEGLRSIYDTVGGISGVGRTLDKIRLHEKGTLPEAYHRFLGTAIPLSVDAAVCRFLQVDYDALRRRTLDGGTDDEVLAWVFAESRTPEEEAVSMFNDVLRKRGWRDETSDYLRERVIENGFSPKEVQTWPDLIDVDEGRPLRFPQDPPPPEKPVKPTALIPGLRSPYEKVGGVVHVGRMIDKIRLADKGALPPDWTEFRGAVKGYDGMTCGFLGVDYAAVEEELRNGKSDDEVAAWAMTTGRGPAEQEIANWNNFLSKRCWRDAYTPRLHLRLEEAGMPVEAALVMFDFIDIDEGRPLRFGR